MPLKVFEGSEFLPPQIVMQVVAEVAEALRDGEPVRRGFSSRDGREVRAAGISRPGELPGERAGLNAVSGRPDGEYERQPGPAAPLVAQIPDQLKGADGPFGRAAGIDRAIPNQ